MFIYMLSLLLAAAANIFFTVDVEKKSKYSSDVLVIGMLAGLIGNIVRTVQLGLLFSWKYYIAYLVFSIVFFMLISKHTKNEGNEKVIMGLLGAMAVYSIFELVRWSGLTVYAGFSWGYYRLAEALLFVSYIMTILINKASFENFKDGLGKYKDQIPSRKIVMIILVFLAVVSFGIGGIVELGNKKSVNTVTETKTVVEKEEETQNKASGTVSGTVTEKDKPVVKDNKEVEKIEQIALNQVVSTEDYEFTLNRVEFSYKVEPDNPPSWYTYYDAPENEVYIYVNASVKNKMKQSVKCDEVYSVTVDYNGGYTYKGFNIANDTDGDFTYANITSVEPLQTLGVHCLIACPEEVETSEHPVLLKFTLKDGTKFEYVMR